MKTDDYFINEMSKFGIIVWKLYTIRIFRDGDGVSFIYNKWHPLTYLLMFINLLGIFTGTGSDGVKSEWKFNKMCWDFTDYWKKPENEIVWIKRV